MSNYVKATDFASKDALTTGNPLKLIKGTEINDELNAIQTAVATKADLASPAFTGNPTSATQALGNNTTRLATTAFVQQEITASEASASITSGTIANVAITGGTISGLTTDLAVADGGTGASTLAANAVLLGNGTSALQSVAPSTSGNVLTSNGTTWTSSAAPTGITNTGGSAPFYAARAFVSFNGSTNTILSSKNVSSITKNGTGDYTVNFTTAMSSSNYCTLLSNAYQGQGEFIGVQTQTTSSVRVKTRIIGTTSGVDFSIVNVVVFE